LPLYLELIVIELLLLLQAHNLLMATDFTVELVDLSFASTGLRELFYLSDHERVAGQKSAAGEERAKCKAGT
jgi:hypothetical protein